MTIKAIRQVCLVLCSNAEIIADYVGLPADHPYLGEVIDAAFAAAERVAAREGIATRYEPHFRDWRGGRFDGSAHPNLSHEGPLDVLLDDFFSLKAGRVCDVFYRTLIGAAERYRWTQVLVTPAEGEPICLRYDAFSLHARVEYCGGPHGYVDWEPTFARTRDIDDLSGDLHAACLRVISRVEPTFCLDGATVEVLRLNDNKPTGDCTLRSSAAI